MNALLYAHAGSYNHGCEALVRSTASLLDIPCTLYTSAPEEDEACGLAQLVSIREDTSHPIPRRSAAYIAAAAQTKLTGKTTLFTKFARKALLSDAAQADVCLSIGGDNYCYGGTDILGDLNLLMKRSGCRTVLWGCSIDPDALTPSVVQDLKRYDLITVRECLTREALASAGVTENVRAVADPAFLLDTQEIPLPEGFVPGNTIGLNLSPLILGYTDRKEQALESFYALVRHILETTDSTIALIPHVSKPNGSDTEILEPIYEQFQETGRVILVPDHNCMELKYLISQCRLFIGARTHSTIAAYSTCVPTLVVGYSVKSRGIAADLFGTDEHYVLPVNRIYANQDLIQAYDWLELHAAEIREQLCAVIPAYKEKARMGKTFLTELLSDSSAG